MRKRLLAACLFVSTLAGCGGIANPTPTPLGSDSISYPVDTAVLQLAHGGGFVMIDRVSELIPDVTVWGDGRVVFAAPDGTVREGVIDPAVVAKLVQSASFLYNLKSDYAAVQHTDAPTATFAIFTERGGKQVSVYGLDPVSQQEDEPEPGVFAQLRALWAQVNAALPADAAELKPTSVCIQTFHTNEPATAEWPAELTGCLTGDVARKAVSLAGLNGGKVFRVGGQAMSVLVVPQVPRPGEAEKPGSDAIEAPAQLNGSVQDDSLAVEAAAAKQPDGTYQVTVKVTNKLDEGIDLLFDCGSLFSWVGMKAPADEGAGFACPTVYSQTLEAKAAEQWELALDPKAVDDWSKLALYLRYELPKGQEIQGLEIRMTAAGE